MHLRALAVCAFILLALAPSVEAQCSDPCTPVQVYEPAGANYFFNANVPEDLRTAFQAEAERWNLKMEARNKPYRMAPGCCFEVKVDSTLPDGVLALWTSGTSIAFQYTLANGPNANIKESASFHEIAHQLVGWGDVYNSNCDYKSSVMTPKSTTDFDNPTDVTTADRCGLNRDMGYSSTGGGGGGGDDLYKCYPYCTPLIIDLDGAGITMSPPNVSFDILAEGRMHTVSWTQAESFVGFLALDRDGDGLIHDGRELFGNATPLSSTLVGETASDGFAAASFFDEPANGGNGDGRLDAADSVFEHLVVWIDWNHDAISQPSELKPLKAVGLVSLGLAPKESQRRDCYGNLFKLRAPSLVKRDGKAFIRFAYDVYLVSK